MHIYINNEYREIPDSINTVVKLLSFLRINAQGTGIAVNNRLVVSRNWESTIIKEDDRVTIISATYGG